MSTLSRTAAAALVMLALTPLPSHAAGLLTPAAGSHPPLELARGRGRAARDVDHRQGASSTREHDQLAGAG